MEKYEFSDSQRLIIEHSPVPFGVYQLVDQRVVTIALSGGFFNLFGYKDRKTAYHDMDHDMYRCTHPDDTARVAEAGYRFAEGESDRYEEVYRVKLSGRSSYMMIHAIGEHAPTLDGRRLEIVWYMNEGDFNAGGREGDFGLNRMLSNAMQEESILHANYYDFLTGLPSMKYFFELAEAGRKAILEAGRKPVILFTDLSGMKYYNRRHGFACGDVLLKSFAKLLVKYFSNENCSRVSEDHFAVFTEEEGVEEIIRKIFREWDSINGDDALPVRVGIYRNSTEIVNASVACDRAKYACDSARNIYESCIRYFDGFMLEEVLNRQYILGNFDRALNERWIDVYYQPIVRSTNGRVCDEEALSRWIDPEKGMLSPAAFIPVLEESNVIYKLDLYLLDRVIEKVRRMKDEGLYVVPQSINLSRTDFESCDIIEEVTKRVDAAGLSRDVFTIEITESTVGNNFDFMKQQVEKFRELGFPVWMDDFGSGYSSLDVLQSIKFDLIKFDMHFMRQFNEGEGGRIILTELMKMASGLGVETLCEGVETEEQVEFLREVGCSKIQGYYYGKPMSSAEIARRQKQGTNLAVEDPREAEYYDAIGRINLYDLAVISDRNDREMNQYFDTLPMAILEMDDFEARFLRNNRSFREFMDRVFGFRLSSGHTEYNDIPKGPARTFLCMLADSCGIDSRTIFDGKLPDNKTVHSFIRRISTNPVTGNTAYAVAILSVADDSEDATYANLARALASDYFNLYYVNTDTDEFIEYTSGVGEEGMFMERHGLKFFESAHHDARRLVYEDDLDMFVNSFTRDNVMRALEEQGSFSLEYRLIIEEKPVYVDLKTVRMNSDSSHIIIGISNVDAQMNEKKAFERMKQNQIIYSRLQALLGDFLVMYMVDPETGRYTETSARTDYDDIGLAKQGEDFFLRAEEDGRSLVAPRDLHSYLKQVTKENIINKIESEGLFTAKYHLVIDGNLQLVKMRAAFTEEDGKRRMIVGVNAIHD